TLGPRPGIVHGGWTPGRPPHRTGRGDVHAGLVHRGDQQAARPEAHHPRPRIRADPGTVRRDVLVKKYYSESVFPGHTILNLERQALQSNPRPQGHRGLLKLSRKSERRSTLHRGKSLTRGSSPMDV